MDRARLAKEVLAHCYCRLEPSPIHGIGVFAVRNIPRLMNPFGTLSKYSRLASVRVSLEELEGLPAKLADTIRTLFLPSEDGVYVPTSGLNVINIMAYVNHTVSPNLRTIDGFHFFTRRRIREVEELTVDYRTYGAEMVLGAQKEMKPGS